MNTNSDPPSSPPPSNVPPPNATPPNAFQGSFRLFRFARVDVFIHWSWFLAAYFLIRDRPVPYSSLAWDIAEYVAGFAIVLMHEFGHVFACRSVGGTANRVLLWPLGGLAFVTTPPRPGANLRTTIAGPLVNAFLAPVLIGLAMSTAPEMKGEVISDFHQFCYAVAWFNVVMLVFNLLPVFPLDGGQILHSLLWFLLDRGRSLMIAAGIGIIAAAGLFAFAVDAKLWWLALMSAFLMLGAFGGLKQAQALIALSRAECRYDRACPHCRCGASIGAFWKCGKCQSTFDPFESLGLCPRCGGQVQEVLCPNCGKAGGLAAWIVAEPASIPNEGWITSEDYQQPPKPSS